jgi:holo-[acyl-carrier protein] synthase
MSGAAVGDVARIRVGTDLVHVTEIGASIESFGDRYLNRIFTPAELLTCRATNGWSVERLAARFAAKEAATKVLRPEDGLSYHSIEVVLDDAGAPKLVLHDSAKLRAEALGLQDTSLSISHDGDYAVAILAAVFAANHDDTRKEEQQP